MWISQLKIIVIPLLNESLCRQNLVYLPQLAVFQKGGLMSALIVAEHELAFGLVRRDAHEFQHTLPELAGHFVCT